MKNLIPAILFIFFSVGKYMPSSIGNLPMVQKVGEKAISAMTNSLHTSQAFIIFFAVPTDSIGILYLRAEYFHGPLPRALVACQFYYPQIDSIRDIRLILSHDHGRSWVSMNPPQPANFPITEIALTAQGIYIPNFHGGFVFFSGDEGMNWDTIFSPGPKCYRV